MKTLRMYPSSINDRYLDEVAECLAEGGIIIYPTDTLYAIGCDALDNRAVERLCRIKGIDPRRQTLSVVCSSISMASDYARIDNEAFRILRSNLPGPFTFILPAATSLPKVFKGRREVGIRIPDNPIPRAIAERIGHPMLSSSLKIDEETGALDIHELADTFSGAVSLIVDDGEGVDTSAMPSTVVSLIDSSSPEILREGRGMLN